MIFWDQCGSLTNAFVVLVVIADTLFFTHRYQFSELCTYLLEASGHSVLDR